MSVVRIRSYPAATALECIMEPRAPGSYVIITIMRCSPRDYTNMANVFVHGLGLSRANLFQRFSLSPNVRAHNVPFASRRLERLDPRLLYTLYSLTSYAHYKSEYLTRGLYNRNYTSRASTRGFFFYALPRSSPLHRER